jgi:hypothetical protein
VLHQQVKANQPNTIPSYRMHVKTARSEHHKNWMPKMDFPQYDGTDARILVDKCDAYFTLYQIPTTFWVSATSLHMVGPATHLYQSYKHYDDFQHWDFFAQTVVREFEVDTHRVNTMELLNPRQTRSVEEYRRTFEQRVYNIRLYDSSLSEVILTSQFILGLKDDIQQKD